MKRIYAALGTFSLALGIAGIFLPLLPTTPFMLLTAWLYCKSSPRLYGWLMTHPYLGSYIRNYRGKSAIPLSGKIASILLLWITIPICIFMVAEALWLKIVLAAILAAVTWHLLSFRTLKSDENVRFVPVRTKHLMERLGQFPFTSPLPDNAASYETIAAATDAGHIFYLLRAAGCDAGCIWIKPEGETCLRLHGIHIDEKCRGKGYAKEALIFLDHYCTYHGIRKIRLTIEKSNGRGIAMYVKSGFMITAESAEDEPGNCKGSYMMERDLP